MALRPILSMDKVQHVSKQPRLHSFALQQLAIVLFGIQTLASWTPLRLLVKHYSYKEKYY